MHQDLPSLTLWESHRSKSAGNGFSPVRLDRYWRSFLLLRQATIDLFLCLKTKSIRVLLLLRSGVITSSSCRIAINPHLPRGGWRRPLHCKRDACGRRVYVGNRQQRLIASGKQIEVRPHVVAPQQRCERFCASPFEYR